MIGWYVPTHDALGSAPELTRDVVLKPVGRVRGNEKAQVDDPHQRRERPVPRRHAAASAMLRWGQEVVVHGGHHDEPQRLGAKEHKEGRPRDEEDQGQVHVASARGPRPKLDVR